MFPKGSTRKHKAFSLELQQTHSTVLQMEPGKERDLLESRCRLLRTAISQIDNDKGNLRVDIELRDPHAGEDRWVDTTIIHPTCKSHKKAELKQTISMKKFQHALQVSQESVDEIEEKRGDRKREEKKGDNNRKHEKQNKKEKEEKEGEKKERGERKVERQQPGSTVAKQELLKVKTYSPLVRIATEQFEKGKREVLPVFHPFVVSTLGEEGPLAVGLREWIIRAYARKLEREGPRDDGRKIEHMTADFRSRFRCSMHIAVAKGLARMISSAGFPTTSCAKHTG